MRSTRHPARTPLKRHSHAAAARLLPYIIAVLLMLARAEKAQAAFDLVQYYEQNNGKTFHNKEEFFQNFPYAVYLKNSNFTDIPTLQKDRYYLWTKFGDGDQFLYRLTEAFLTQSPIPTSPTVADLNQKIDVGEQFLNPNRTRRRRVNEIYSTIGYFILGKVGRKIEQEIRASKYDVSQPDRAKVIQRLANARVYVAREESAGNKLLAYAKQGRYHDIWTRIRSSLHRHEKKVWNLGIAMLVVSIAAFFAGLLRRLKLLRFIGAFGVIAAVIPLSILIYDAETAYAAPTKTGIPAPSPTPVQTTFQLTLQSNLHPINNGTDYAVKVYTLSQNNKEIGQVIWMDREGVKASYLAFENVPVRYNAYKLQNKVALATTGGYTNTSHQPEGFTTEQGNVVNAVIMPDRDGLAMVSDGGINVLNLKNEEFQLPRHGPTIKNPLNCTLD